MQRTLQAKKKAWPKAKMCRLQNSQCIHQKMWSIIVRLFQRFTGFVAFLQTLYLQNICTKKYAHQNAPLFQKFVLKSFLGSATKRIAKNS